MKSRRKHALRLGVLALALGGVWAAYDHFGLLPGRLLSEALLEMGTYSGKKITCDKIIYLPFRGLTFDRLSVTENDGRPIFTAKQFSAHVRLLPFFRDKKIIIDNLHLDEPQFDWTLASERKKGAPPPKTVISGQIEVPVAGAMSAPDLKDLAGGPDIFLPENVYLEQMEIHDGLVRVHEKIGAPPFEEIRAINIRMGFQKPPVVRFDGKVRLGSDDYASIDLRGQWNLKNDRYDFFLSVLGQKVPDWLRRWQQKRLLTLERGQYTLNAHLLSGDGDDVLFQTDAYLKEATLKVSSSQYDGYVHVKAEGSFDSILKKFKRYNAQLELTRVTALDLSPKIKELRDLTGLVELKPNLLTVKTIRGSYKGVAFDASGTIESFTERRVDGKIVSRLTIQELRALLPKEQLEKIKNLEIEGICEAVTKLSGSLKAGENVEMESRLSIHDASVKDPLKKMEWTALSAEVGLDKQGLRIHSSSFSSMGRSFLSKAYIPNQMGQPGWVDIRSEDIQLHAEYTMTSDSAQLKNATAHMPGITASFEGKAYDWQDPALSLKGDVEFDLEKIALSKGSLALFKDRPLSGKLKGPFILNGVWNRPLDWELKIDAKGPVVHLGKLSFQDIESQIRMKNRLLNIPYLHAGFYGGTVGSKILFKLGSVDTYFDSHSYMNSIDLSKLGPDWTPPAIKLSGTLTAQATVRGVAQKETSWHGQGVANIANGHLWETTQFKEMGTLPLVKVEGLDVVTFRGMNTKFQVRDKKMHTEDLALSSDAVELSLKGDLLFDGTLDMTMNIRYSDDIYRGAQDTGGIAPLIVGKAGDSISDYHVLGSLKEPRYEKIR